MPVEVIAEAGISHLGLLMSALQLADIAKQSGADALKIRTYDVDKILRPGDRNHLLYSNISLSRDNTKTLANHCTKIGLEFMSTPGDLDSLKFLVEECGVKRIKIGSDDLTHRPLVEAAYETGLPVILSTGMSTIDDIKGALPSNENNSITLMHCVSLYPTPMGMANLLRLKKLHVLGYQLGYSDHTQTFVSAYMAMALGAIIIEKHFAPYNYNGPQKEVSITPIELRLFVSGIKDNQKLLGSGKLEPSSEEANNIPIFRKGADGFRGYLNGNA